MPKLRLYARLVWIFTLSLFIPTSALTRRVEETLAEIKGEPLPPRRDA